MAYLTKVASSILTNQDISSSLLAHTYTNATRIRELFFEVNVNQIAGCADTYSVYISKQLSGTGSFYPSLKTSGCAVQGASSIYFGSIPVIVDTTDVVRLYVTGASNDSASVGVVTSVFETLPAVAGDAMALTASGISASNVATGAGISASDVWAHSPRTLTQSAASVAAALSGSVISITRGDTTTIAITGLGNIATRTKLYFTIKDNYNSADTAAIVKVEETAGLQVLNGSTTVTTTDATLTVDNATTGDITIVLKAALTAALVVTPGLYYDVQVVTSSAVNTLTSNFASVVYDVTLATT